MTCQFAHDDGAYVLGALDPAERRAFEDHLPHCASCRSAVSGLAGLPGLLAHVPPTLVENLGRAGAESTGSTGTVVAIAPAPDPVPDTLLPRLMWAARVERRRARRRNAFVASGIAAAAAAIVLTGTLVATSGQDTPARPDRPPIAVGTAKTLTMKPAGENAGLPISATVKLTETSVGTRLEVECDWRKVTADDYSPAPSYQLVVSDNAGTSQQIATFKVRLGEVFTVPGTTKTPVKDLSNVEIRGENGDVLLSTSA